MKIFYKTPTATSTGGRSGHVALEDGSLGFDLQTPEQNSTGVNPEKLFAMGYAACFQGNRTIKTYQTTTVREKTYFAKPAFYNV